MINLSNDFWEKVSKFEIILRRFNAVHSLTNYRDLRAVAQDSVKPFLNSNLNNDFKFETDKFTLAQAEQITLGGSRERLRSPSQGVASPRREVKNSPFFKFESKIIIDVGSGAGFPAIFLAFLLPESEIHLFEPAPKKSAFLAFAKTELALKNVRVHAAKIQNCEKFRADLVTSRALARARDLIALCDGFYDENTTFLLYKGGEAQNEAREIAANNSNLNYALKNGAGERKYLYLKGLKCC